MVYFDAKSETEFDKFKGKLKGAIVLVSPIREVAAQWEPLAARKTDSELLALADAAEATQQRGGRRAALAAQGQRGPGAAAAGPGAAAAGPGAAAAGPRAAAGAPAAPVAIARSRRAPGAPGRHLCVGGRFASPEMLAQIELQRKKTQFLADQEIAMLVEPSTQGDGGTFFVQSASIPGAARSAAAEAADRVPHAPRSTPRTHPRSFLRSCSPRNITTGSSACARPARSVKIAVELKVEFHDQDLMSYNTVAEIPGTDLKHELVMLGGHMDSWHSGTGATDNGAGVSVGMEAVASSRHST